MCIRDRSPLVRRRLASAAQRIAANARWPLIEALALHGEDANDQNLPLMNWYAAEAAVAADPARGVTLLQSAKIPRLHEFIARRVTFAAIENGAKAGDVYKRQVHTSRRCHSRRNEHPLGTILDDNPCFIIKKPLRCLQMIE